MKHTRAQRIVSRKKAMDKCRRWANQTMPDLKGHALDAWVRRTYQHPKVCSCSMCANERSSKKWKSGLEKLTLSERKAAEAYKEEVNSLE